MFSFKTIIVMLSYGLNQIQFGASVVQDEGELAALQLTFLVEVIPFRDYVQDPVDSKVFDESPCLTVETVAKEHRYKKSILFRTLV